MLNDSSLVGGGSTVLAMAESVECFPIPVPCHILQVSSLLCTVPYMTVLRATRRPFLKSLAFPMSLTRWELQLCCRNLHFLAGPLRALSYSWQGGFQCQVPRVPCGTAGELLDLAVMAIMLLLGHCRYEQSWSKTTLTFLTRWSATYLTLSYRGTRHQDSGEFSVFVDIKP